MTDKEKIREEVVGIINSINLFAPDEDGKNSSYEEGRLVVASQILQIIDSLQEEPVSKDLEKENKIEILADIIFNAAKHGYMPYDMQDEYCAMEIARKNIDKFIVPKKQEEPVSIDFEQELYKAFGQVKDFTLCMRIAKWFYDMGKNSQEPASEDLNETIPSDIIGKELRSFLFGKKHPTINDLGIIADVARHFANWQKEQMMANATEVTVHIDAGGYPYTPEIELYDYDKDVPLAKEGDKYKVVLIRED